MHVLQGEHFRLLNEVERIVVDVESATALGPELTNQFEAFASEFTRHEEEEDRVLQDAFELDIGAED